MFDNCVMEDNKEDPQKWIARLTVLNAKLTKIRTAYTRDTVQMISHILPRLPQEYKAFVTHFNVARFGGC